MNPPSKAKSIFSWILQILCAAAFFAAGGAKLAGAPPMVQLFDAVGVGQWFRYVTGVIEVGSGILLLIPGMAAIGAVLLACTMTGAILTHLFIIHSSPLNPVVLLILALLIAWMRKDTLARFAGSNP